MSAISFFDAVLVSSNHLTQQLSDGSLVIYSSSGPSHVFVLTDLSLEIYDLLRTGKSVKDILNSFESPYVRADVLRILDFFRAQHLLTFTSEFKRIGGHVRNNHHSLSLWIHVADICNLRCDYCYVHKGTRRMSREACNLIVASLRHDIINNGVKEILLKFAGGEPLVDREIIEYLITRSREELIPLGVRLRFAIITNGTLITRTVAEFLKENSFSVMVSLDGLDYFNDARKYVDGRSSVHDVLRGIETSIIAGIKPVILTTLSDYNVQGLWDLMQFCCKRDLTLSLSISRDFVHGVGLTIDVPQMILHIQHFLENVIALDDSELPRLSFNGIQFAGRRTRICTGGSTYFAIDPFGNVCFCQMCVSSPLGAAKADEGILTFSSNVVTLSETSDCGRCAWKYVCCGGCAVLAQNSGTLGKPSLMCELMKGVLPLVLAYEGRKLIRKEVTSHVNA